MTAPAGTATGRVLVTGAGGFIGGHLARAAAAAGAAVTALMHRARPAAMERLAGVRLEQADLAGHEPLPGGPFDAVVHCAAAIPATTPDDDELLRINSRGTRRLWEHAVRAGATTMIYCSSMAVYGEVDRDLVDPNTPVRDPGAYGRSKLAGEQALEQLCAGNAGIAGLSIRLPGVVGAGSHDNFLSEALRCVLAGKEVVARNPDSLFNNIVHIGDLAEFVIHLLASLPRGYHVTTIAADEPLPVRRVIALMCEVAGRPQQVRYQAAAGRPFLISPEPARRLGYRVPTVESSVRRFVGDVLAAAGSCVG